MVSPASPEDKFLCPKPIKISPSRVTGSAASPMRIKLSYFVVVVESILLAIVSLAPVEITRRLLLPAAATC